MGLTGTIWQSICPHCGGAVTRRRPVVSVDHLNETRDKLGKAIHIAEAALDALDEKDPFYADSLGDELRQIKHAAHV